MGPAPFLVMGIVNATPDSFSGDGLNSDPDAAVAHAGRLFAEGAAIVDVGGESTRPFADPVPQEEELRRVLSVITRIAAEFPGAALSVDTYKAVVADRCLSAGAHIVNDVSACSLDPELQDVLVAHKPGYVLMHSLGGPKTMQMNPRYDDVLGEITRFFHERMTALVQVGLPEDRIVLDPGIGFGKTPEHNLAILRGLERFQAFGRPICIGLSRKSFLGAAPHERDLATQEATVMAYQHGARIHRVHAVRDAVCMLMLSQALV